MVYMIDGSYRFAAACARDHMFFLPRLAALASRLFDQEFVFFISCETASSVLKLFIIDLCIVETLK